MGPISHKAKQRLSWGLGIFFSLIVILWAIFALDWQQVKQALLNADYGWILLAMGILTINYWVRTLRWGYLFWPDSVPFSSLISALIIGQAVNYITPARLGDLARAYIVGQTTGISKARALGTVALEKMWDMAMLILFILILGWFFPLPDWLVAPARGMMLATLGLFLISGFVLWRRAEALTWLERFSQRFIPAFHHRFTTIGRNLLRGFDSLQNVRLVFIAGGLSLAVWVLGVLTNYVLFLAFDLSLPMTAALLLMVVLQVGVAVPSLPGRIGVFEGLCVIVLALFNVPFDIAFSYGLVLHVIVFIPPILLAVILFWMLDFGITMYDLRTANDER